MRKKICAAMFILSLIYMIGVAGTSDTVGMEFTELAMRMFGSGAVMLLCIWIGGFNE
jgi:hypothetical protein